MPTKKLYDKLTVIAPIGGKRPVAKPDEKAFAAVERKLALTLPESYKRFMARFGPGQLGGYFNIRGPGYGPKSNADLGALVTLFRDDREMYVDLYGDEAFVDRCIPFCDTIGGDLFVWDPKPKTTEHAVSLLADGTEKVKKAAPDFDTLLGEVFLGKGFGKLVGDPKYQPAFTFAPFGRS